MRQTAMTHFFHRLFRKSAKTPQKPLKTKALGRIGEQIACRFLKKKGYKILERNYRSQLYSGPQRGEIDIVAKKGSIFCFVEVKTKISPPQSSVSLVDSSLANFSFAPEMKVNSIKQRKIIKTAKEWLAEKNISADSPWQIDIVSILINPEQKKARLKHFKNV